ncbi:MAG: DUF4385 domain-containing protein [Candidatus Levybacteria bacterium]|nr:DUF4385 domain-containing protein [Candidatus Levybacteria bacterium]
MQKFDYTKDFKNINFRESPHLYQVGKGEQGVLLVEPYKSEIVKHWRFRTPEIAKESSEKIYQMFLDYKKQNDFVGMDMTRKFLQMGYTRARRYANHASGKKYKENPQNKATERDKQAARKDILPQDTTWQTNEKAQSAKIFYGKYLVAREDEEYKEKKKLHQQKYG